MPTSVRDVVERAIAAHEALGALAESVEDEWQYVTDLRAAWQARLRAVADERGDAAVSPAIDVAVARVALEASLVADPHRAIDWLSTLPQVVLLALDEPG